MLMLIGTADKEILSTYLWAILWVLYLILWFKAFDVFEDFFKELRKYRKAKRDNSTNRR